MSLRSWLFVPGNEGRKLEKAADSPADALIYDLEDAVPVREKENARKQVKQAIRDRPDRQNFLRVNALSTPYGWEDFKEGVVRGLKGIVLPKVTGADDIRLADRWLEHWELERGLKAGSVEVVPLIESALGLYHAFAVATSNRRVRRLAFGSVDFTLDILAEPTRDGKELLYARSHLVVVSRAAGIEPPVDGVFTELRDDEGLRRDTRLAKELGFQGKLAIHPRQVEPIHQVFTPSPEEIREAKKIVESFALSEATGRGVVEVSGKMVDPPVVEKAKRMLEWARDRGD